MESRKIKDLKALRKPTLVHFDTPIDELVRMFVEAPAIRNLCVLDENDALIGLIDQERLFRTLHSRNLHPATRISELYRLATAECAQEIMNTHPITATSDDDVENVIAIMLSQDLFEIPVIDSKRHLIGILDSNYFLKAWVEKNR